MRLLSLVAAVSLATVPAAQTLIGVDDSGQLVEFAGPKDAALCDYPLGPLLGLASYVTSSPCHELDLPGGGSAGDIAVNRVDNVVWVTDGSIVAEMQSFGTALRSFDATELIAGPITGLAYDVESDLLWLSNGAGLTAVSPPPPPFPCEPATVVVGSVVTPAPGVITGVDWDPSTDTLWLCDDLGFVVNVETDGSFGPFGAIQPSAGNPCGLGAGLEGIAVDTARTGVVYVTDGTNVYYMDASVPLTGGPASPRFYMSSPCDTPPASATALRGIGFTAHPLSFGPTSGGFLPVIGVGGHSVAPNPDFTVGVAGGNENELALLYMTTGGAACPPIPADVPVNLFPIPFFLVASTVLPETGHADLPGPIGGGVPAGLALQLQWFLIDPITTGITSTRGLWLTIARP